jgi:hypothetical protein
MSLTKQVVGIQLQGINAKKPPLLNVPGELQLLENVKQLRDGEFSKRDGKTLMGNVPGARYIDRVGDSGICVVKDTATERSYHTWDADLSAFGERARFNGAYCPVDSDSVATNADPVYASDSCVFSGRLYTAVSNSMAGSAWTELTVSSKDLVTGETKHSIFTTDFRHLVRMVATASRAAVVRSKVSGSPVASLEVSRFDETATWTPTTSVYLGTNVDLTLGFDVVADISSNVIYACYSIVGGGIGFASLDLISGAQTVVSDMTRNANTSISFMAHDQSDGKVWVVTNGTGGSYVISIDKSTLAQTVVRTRAQITTFEVVPFVTGAVVAGKDFVFYNYTDSAPVGIKWHEGARAADSIISLSHLSSKAIVIGSSILFATHQVNSIENRQLLVCMDTERDFGGYGMFWMDRYQANMMPVATYGDAVVQAPNGKMLPNLAVSAGDIFVTTYFNYSDYLVSAMVVRLSRPIASKSESLGETSFFSCGVGLQIDDGYAAELGFVGQPKIAEPEGSPGTYSYVVVLGRIDKRGRLWRSAPSAPVRKSAISNIGSYIDPSLWGVTDAGLTGNRQGNYKTFAEAYRLDPGQTIYRLAGIGTTQSLGNEAIVANQATAPDLLSKEALYTTGGAEVENIGFTSFSTMTTYRGRLIGADPITRGLVWYTKKSTATKGPMRASTFSVLADSDPAPVSAITDMDDKCIIFKRNDIYVLTGDGPSVAGVGLFDSPERISLNVGCVNARAATKIPSGVVFASEKGIYSLSRGLSLEFIGAPIEEYTRGQDTLSAVTVDSRNQARFVQPNGVKVYDWFFNRWSVETSSVAPIDEDSFDGSVVSIDASGNVYRSSSSVFTDNGAPYTSRIKTGFISLAGLQGFQRVYAIRIAGEFAGAHTLRLHVAYDNVDADVQTMTATATNDGAEYAFEFRPTRQKCSSIRLTIDDNGATTGGWKIQGLSLLVGVKRGLNDSKARKFGA